MKIAEKNPKTNQLGQGIDEAQVYAAIEKSGYPLQTRVAEILRPSFEVQEEWCYVDRDTRELRSIDLRAWRILHGWEPQPRVRPHVDLLVECKQSQLPYVFFLSPGKPHMIVDFPVIAGLRNDQITISTDDDASRWNLTVINTLSLSADAFRQEPVHCNTFSKCVRKGPNIELSGVDAYSSLILPLIKALQHFEVAETAVQTAWYFDAHLLVALGVLDAPMISSAVDDDGKTTLTLLPWVRVLRHEYSDKAERWDKNRVRAVDIVHKDFLGTYLKTHLLPFAERFSERVLRHPTELATSKGFIAGMGADWHTNLEARLHSRSDGSPISKLRSRNRPRSTAEMKATQKK
ncbi:MAG: hypothetical protein WA628_05310 [Terriglobales bacterium]